MTNSIAGVKETTMTASELRDLIEKRNHRWNYRRQKKKRLCSLFLGQWADLERREAFAKAAKFGYEAVELPCWGKFFDPQKIVDDPEEVKTLWNDLMDFNLVCVAISCHLVGQAVCDNIDERHKGILPPEVWGDGDPEGVRKRAAEFMKLTAKAARIFYDAMPAEVKAKLPKGWKRVVNGFTGSKIWHLLYSFPPVSDAMIEAGYKDFADRWLPILDVFEQEDIYFALEVHPTEIAFDIVSAERALKAVGHHKRFGFNYDPSHLLYQGVDYVEFIRQFADRIFHVHMKDVYRSETLTKAGVFGGHTKFGNPDRFWEFRSIGRGSVNFELIIRALNDISYNGPLSVEWEDIGMDREAGAEESCNYVMNVDFTPSTVAFDAAFDQGDKKAA